MLEFTLKLLIGLFGLAMVLIPAGAATLTMAVVVFEDVKEKFLCSETR